MERSNVNWNVGIAADKQSTYTSKAVKAGIPFASQVTEPNTKYIIKYDFDLGGEEVTIPEDCILEFDGGSISNGLVFGNDTCLIGGNKYKSVLVGVFHNENNELIDGTGNILKPNFGFDFAARSNTDLTLSVPDYFYTQGLIHTGKWIFVFVTKGGAHDTYLLRYDTAFNYYGMLVLPLEQVYHGGIGYYEDGFIYIASHIDNSIIKYSVSDIVEAETESTLYGTKITIPTASEITIIFMSHDYSNNTTLLANGNRIIIVDKEFNKIVDTGRLSLPQWIGEYEQDMIWENGFVTIISSYREYSRHDPCVVYYDIHANKFTDVYIMDSKYGNVEVEATTPYIGEEGIRLVCGNNSKKGNLLIGKFSNTVSVKTMETGMEQGYNTGKVVYVDNTMPATVPDGPKITVPNGTTTTPFKNLTSAFYFNVGQKLIIRFNSVTLPYQVPYVCDDAIIIQGFEDSRPKINGSLLVAGGNIQFHYVDYTGSIRTENGSINIYNTVVDGNGADYCLQIDNLSSCIANGSTIKNADKGIRLKNLATFASDYSNLIFKDLTYGIYTDLAYTIDAAYLYKATFNNVQYNIYDSVKAEGVGNTPLSIIPFSITFTENNHGNYPRIISFLDNSLPGLNVRIYNPVDYNDVPKGECTFIHKDITGFSAGTIVGPNGSSLPMAMSDYDINHLINRSLLIGDHTFNKDLGKEVYWTGTGWVDAAGNEIDTETT